MSELLAVPDGFLSLKVLTSLCHFLSLSALSHMISQRRPTIKEIQYWRRMKWAKLCMLLLLISAWCSVMTSGVLLLGIGVAEDAARCAQAVIFCLVSHGIVRLLFNAYLAEKAYIVWCGGHNIPRLKSNVYRICILVTLGGSVFQILLFIEPQSRIRPDGMCLFDFSRNVITGAAIYGVVPGFVFTSMFLWPLWRSSMVSPRLRDMAKRTLYGYLIGSSVSLGCIATLFILKGEELGLLCYNTCLVDIMFNILVLFWINSGPFKEAIEQITLPQILQTNVTSDVQFASWPPVISIDPDSIVSHSWQGPVNFSTAITSTLPEKPTLTRYYTDTTCHRPIKEPHGADTTYEVSYGLTQGIPVHGDPDGLCEEARRPPLLRLHTV